MKNRYEIVLIEGAPRSGKDTIASMLTNMAKDDGLAVLHYKLSYPIKNAVHAAFNINVSHDFFDSIKDVPNQYFRGKTPRAAYIEFAENYMKKFYGNDIFVKLFFRSVDDFIVDNADKKCFIIVSDLGFQVELDMTLQAYDNVNLISVNNKDCDFENDSRSKVEYDKKIEVDNIYYTDSDNSGKYVTLYSLHQKIAKIYDGITGFSV